MIKRLILLLLLTSLSLTTFAQTAKPNNPNSTIRTPQSQEFYPLSQLRKGQRATAYTVFEGTEPKAFELEILGVLEGFNSPKQNAIIVKLVGPDTDRTGVFAGMTVLSAVVLLVGAGVNAAERRLLRWKRPS